MIIVLGSSISAENQNIINAIFSYVDFPLYKIVDIKKEAHPEMEELLNSTVFLMYNKGVNKSTFEKKIEELYGKDIYDKIDYIQIPLPNKFLADDELKQKALEKINSKLSYKIKKFDMNLYPKGFNEVFKEVVSTVNQNKIYRMKLVDNTVITIVPDGYNGFEERYMTFSEFLTVFMAKNLFRVNTIEVLTHERRK